MQSRPTGVLGKGQAFLPVIAQGGNIYVGGVSKQYKVALDLVRFATSNVNM